MVRSSNEVENVNETNGHAPLALQLVPSSLVHIDRFFADGYCLVIHPQLGLITLLGRSAQPVPRMYAQDQFTKKELHLFWPLIDAFPGLCSHEQLYASFHTFPTSPTSEEVKRARLRLQEALQRGLLDHEMRQVRNVLSRIRFKLREFGIELLSIPEHGYLLEVTQKREILTSQSQRLLSGRPEKGRKDMHFVHSKEVCS
jgi:hypothetical protein